MTILDEPPRRYGETRYRCEADGRLTLIRQTQTFVRAEHETAEHFSGTVRTWAARLVLLKKPDESVELLEAWHDDQLTRATVIVAPVEDLAQRRQRQTLERILGLLRAIAKAVTKKS